MNRTNARYFGASHGRFCAHVAGVSLAALMFVACGKQQEGERCSTDNKDEDCDTGLTCQQPAGVTRGQVCCPDRNPSTQICRGDPLAESADTDQDTDDSMGARDAGDPPTVDAQSSAPNSSLDASSASPGQTDAGKTDAGKMDASNSDASTPDASANADGGNR